MAFVKLNRDIIQNDIFHDDGLLAFYIRILLKCKVKKYREGSISVERGQFFTSVRKLASDLDLSYRITLKNLKSLEANQLISITTYSRGSLISVKDFDCTISIMQNTDQSDKLFDENKRITFGGSTLLYNKKNVNKAACGAREQEPTFEKSAESSDNSKFETPTRDSLVEKYGEDNVKDYENRFERWKARQSKPVVITCYDAIERWMRDDGVVKHSSQDSEAAFDVNEIMQRIIDSYNQ